MAGGLVKQPVASEYSSGPWMGVDTDQGTFYMDQGMYLADFNGFLYAHDASARCLYAYRALITVRTFKSINYI